MLKPSLTTTADSGIQTCCRYSFPPNSLSLCGPDRISDLRFYSSTGKTDSGTKEILGQFSTLYPYLKLIAGANNINDPLDSKVVEAYWLGNSLLYKITKRDFFRHLTDGLKLKRKLKGKDIGILDKKFERSPLPQHAFHVLNVYKRTGNMDIPHTVATMDACIINHGNVLEVSRGKLKIATQRLANLNGKLVFETGIIRTVKMQGITDIEGKSIKPGDTVTYHWGTFCKKISTRQCLNLDYFNRQAVNLANLL